MWNQLRVAVVIPAFNEEERLGATLNGIPPWVDVVVVVDDASRDGTSDVVTELADARVVLLRHPHNQGVGAAIRSGYLHGVEHGADVLVVMAADNQMSPDDLPALLEPLRNGEWDYVKGNRFLHPLCGQMPPLRRLGSRFLSALTRLTTDYDVDDCQCGYTAITAAMVRALPLEELWPRYGYPNDLLALLSRRGARVTEVAVRPVYAGEHSGLHPGHVVSIASRVLKRGLETHRAK